MMTRSIGKQFKLVFVNLDEMVPSDHFLRKLNETVDFEFIYDLMEPLYGKGGRPSIDPVVLIKMLLIGYLYGIDSERKLEEEVCFNLVYRWFLGLDLDDSVPDHSTFSQNRRRRFHGTEIFRQIFEHIVLECVKAGLVRGENIGMDSTHIKANADNHNSESVEVIKTPQAFWDELGVAELPAESTVKAKNPCDPEAGYMNRTGKPKGFHYLNHQCSDLDTGIILDVFVTGGDVQDCECCTERFAYLKNQKRYPVRAAGLDSGYDTIEIHAELARLGITGYIHPSKRGSRKESEMLSADEFTWLPEQNCYICPNKKMLTYRGTWYHAGVPGRNYVASMEDCRDCPYREKCFTQKSKARRIVRKPWQEFREAGHQRKGTRKYKWILRRRQVVCEGNFGLQKRCHNLRFTRKRGIENVTEQCLLSACALNLKRLVKGINLPKIPVEKRMRKRFATGIFACFNLFCVDFP